AAGMDAAGLVSRQSRPAIVAVLGSIVAALGIVALSGYLVGLKTYDWGALVPMAAHTASGFALVGLGLVAFAWRDVRREEANLPHWLPIPMVVGGLTASLCLWQPLSAQRYAQAKLPGGTWSALPEAVMGIGFAS